MKVTILYDYSSVTKIFYPNGGNLVDFELQYQPLNSVSLVELKETKTVNNHKSLLQMYQRKRLKVILYKNNSTEK